jgi:hypothetical protein
MDIWQFHQSNNQGVGEYVYFGASLDEALSLSTLNDLQRDAVLSKANQYVAVSPIQDEYVFYVYPTSYGQLQNVIMDDATAILGAFTILDTEFAIDGIEGQSIDYTVVRSNADNAFTNSKLNFI